MPLGIGRRTPASLYDPIQVARSQRLWAKKTHRTMAGKDSQRGGNVVRHRIDHTQQPLDRETPALAKARRERFVDWRRAMYAMRCRKSTRRKEHSFAYDRGHLKFSLIL
jgi:hypothetical protein